MKAMCNCPSRLKYRKHWDSCPVRMEQARKRIAELESEFAAAKEMRVSIPLSHAEVEALRPERLSAIGEMRGWNVGFPAGFAAGARAFAEWCEKNPEPKWDTSPLTCRVDRFLASQRGTDSNNENKEGE